MKAFIKRLFEDRDKELNLILLDDSKPGQDDSYHIVPKKLFTALLSFSVVLLILISLVFMLTPLGSLLYNTDEMEIRNEIKAISTRIIALQDSLETRDRQLRDIQEVIRLNKDTTLSMDERLRVLANPDDENLEISKTTEFENINIFEQFDSGDLLSINVLKNAPDFPANSPVQGTSTRGYEPQAGHFGLDLATKQDAEFVSVADGTVLWSSWTIDYGYVISVQHKDGIVSTYKHCSKVYKNKGEKVLKGETLGLTGDTGILSSGPHLHFEIWKNGVSQNPISYLIL